MKTEERSRHTVWMENAVWQRVQEHYKSDGCSTQNEFIAKAILFYCGYLQSEYAGDFLSKILGETLEAILSMFGDRIGKLLLKQAVEQNVCNHILASDTDIDARSYYIIAHLRADNGKEKKGRKVVSYGGAECCLKRISTARIKKRTAARTSLEAAFSWEGFSSIMRNVCIFIRVFPMDEL